MAASPGEVLGEELVEPVEGDQVLAVVISGKAKNDIGVVPVHAVLELIERCRLRWSTTFWRCSRV
jgi:hypothetical protein